jgi:hypothetical protein
MTGIVFGLTRNFMPQKISQCLKTEWPLGKSMVSRGSAFTEKTVKESNSNHGSSRVPDNAMNIFFTVAIINEIRSNT